MLLQVPEDSFQNIFDLSFDSEDSKCVLGSRGLDFLSSLSPKSLNSYNNNNHNNNNNNNSYSNKNKNANSFEVEKENNGDIKSWRDEFLSSPSGSQQEELEQAFAKLYSNRGQPSSTAQVLGSIPGLLPAINLKLTYGLFIIYATQIMEERGISLSFAPGLKVQV